jgi:iron uptake system component EfeO
MFRTPRRALLVAALSSTALVAGFAGTAVAKSSTVKVDINDDGCPAKLTVKAGPTTFKVTNSGSGDVSEFEILSGDRIVGEVENVAPGLNKEFSLTLKAGKYTTKCPGGSEHSTGKLVVSGATAKLSADGKDADGAAPELPDSVFADVQRS